MKQLLFCFLLGLLQLSIASAAECKIHDMGQYGFLVETFNSGRIRKFFLPCRPVKYLHYCGSNESYVWDPAHHAHGLLRVEGGKETIVHAELGKRYFHDNINVEVLPGTIVYSTTNENVKLLCGVCIDILWQPRECHID